MILVGTPETSFSAKVENAPMGLQPNILDPS